MWNAVKQEACKEVIWILHGGNSGALEAESFESIDTDSVISGDGGF